MLYAGTKCTRTLEAVGEGQAAGRHAEGAAGRVVGPEAVQVGRRQRCILHLLDAHVHARLRRGAGGLSGGKQRQLRSHELPGHLRAGVDPIL
jgi:hypothetical protein